MLILGKPCARPGGCGKTIPCCICKKIGNGFAEKENWIWKIKSGAEKLELIFLYTSSPCLECSSLKVIHGWLLLFVQLLIRRHPLKAFLDLRHQKSASPPNLIAFYLSHYNTSTYFIFHVSVMEILSFKYLVYVHYLFLPTRTSALWAQGLYYARCSISSKIGRNVGWPGSEEQKGRKLSVAGSNTDIPDRNTSLIFVLSLAPYHELRNYIQIQSICFIKWHSMVSVLQGGISDFVIF